MFTKVIMFIIIHNIEKRYVKYNHVDIENVRRIEMILENGIYEYEEGKFGIVLRVNETNSMISMRLLEEFDPNYYGEGDPYYVEDVAIIEVHPELLNEQTLRGHKYLLLDYLLEEEELAKGYDLTKYIKGE